MEQPTFQLELQARANANEEDCKLKALSVAKVLGIPVIFAFGEYVWKASPDGKMELLPAFALGNIS